MQQNLYFHWPINYAKRKSRVKNKRQRLSQHVKAEILQKQTKS